MCEGFQYRNYMQLMTCCIDDNYDGALGIYRIFDGVPGTRIFRVNRVKVVRSTWALSAEVASFVHYLYAPRHMKDFLVTLMGEEVFE